MRPQPAAGAGGLEGGRWPFPSPRAGRGSAHMWLQDTGFLGQQRVPRENARWKEVGTSPERARAVGSQQQPPVFPGPESPVKTWLPTQGPGAGVGGADTAFPMSARASEAAGLGTRSEWPGRGRRRWTVNAGQGCGTLETVDPAAGVVAWKVPSPDDRSTGGDSWRGHTRGQGPCRKKHPLLTK